MVEPFPCRQSCKRPGILCMYNNECKGKCTGKTSASCNNNPPCKEQKKKCVWKRSLYPNSARLLFNFVSRTLFFPPSKTSFVDGGSERILIIWLLIIEVVTSRFEDMAVKRLRNCQRKEVGSFTHRMIKNNLYKWTSSAKSLDCGKSQHKMKKGIKYSRRNESNFSFSLLLLLLQTSMDGCSFLAVPYVFE